MIKLFFLSYRVNTPVSHKHYNNNNSQVCGLWSVYLGILCLQFFLDTKCQQEGAGKRYEQLSKHNTPAAIACFILFKHNGVKALEIRQTETSLSHWSASVPPPPKPPCAGTQQLAHSRQTAMLAFRGGRGKGTAWQQLRMPSILLKGKSYYMGLSITLPAKLPI